MIDQADADHRKWIMHMALREIISLANFGCQLSYYLCIIEQIYRLVLRQQFKAKLNIKLTVPKHPDDVFTVYYSVC